MDWIEPSSPGWLRRVRAIARAIETNIARHPILFAAAFVAIYGWKKEDFSDFRLLTENPFVTHPATTRQFLHSSPLTLFLGWPLTHLLGAHASYTIAGTGGFILLLFALRLYLRPVPPERRPVVLFVVFSTPILLVLTRWIGKNDPYLLALFLLVLTFRCNVVLSAGFSLLLVLSHKELGTIMLLGDALLRWSLRPSIVAGAGLGNGLVWLYLASLTEPPFSRVQLALSFLSRGIEGWANNPLAHLLFSFSWFWFFLFVRSRELDTGRMTCVVLLCFAISLDGADFTRDFILCAFPLVIYTAEKMAQSPASAAVVTRRPFPLVFLLQMQVESFDLVRDMLWPAKLMPLFHQFWGTGR